jgi:hypothetical protein
MRTPLNSKASAGGSSTIVSLMIKPTEAHRRGTTAGVALFPAILDSIMRTR